MEDVFIFSKKGECRNCQRNSKWILHRQFFNNCSQNFTWNCETCNTKNPGRDPSHFIAREKVETLLTSEQIDALPCLMPAMYCRCARCGGRGGESHHWAPVGIFGKEEADKWPMDFLCKDCHDQWHRLVTPALTTDVR